MAISNKTKKIIDITQWLIIGILLVACAVVFIGNKKLKERQHVINDETYIKIYESQAIETLKKKNKALYDSLMVERGRKPESAIEIRYKYKYVTDTITKTEFVQTEDSVYHYASDNDTVKTEIDLKASDLDWVNVRTTISDKFTIINRTGDDGTVETTINHSPNVEIEHVDTWHVKKTWKDNLFFGPSASAGYDPIRRKPSIIIGVSVGYNLWKH